MGSAVRLGAAGWTPGEVSVGVVRAVITNFCFETASEPFPFYLSTLSGTATMTTITVRCTSCEYNGSSGANRSGNGSLLVCACANAVRTHSMLCTSNMCATKCTKRARRPPTSATAALPETKDWGACQRGGWRRLVDCPSRQSNSQHGRRLRENGASNKITSLFSQGNREGAFIFHTQQHSVPGMLPPGERASLSNARNETCNPGQASPSRVPTRGCRT